MSPGKSVIGVWAVGQPAARAVRARRTAATRARGRPVGAGLAARQPAVQRGDRADGRQGPLERAAAGGRQRSSLDVRPAPRAGRAAAGAVPGRVPEPGRADTAAAGRPGGDPADRASRPASSRASRTSPGRRYADHAAAEHGDPADAASPKRARGCSAATWPASRTGGACSTTWSPSSCGRSPARRIPLVNNTLHAGRRGLRSSPTGSTRPARATCRSSRTWGRRRAGTRPRRSAAL